MRQVVSVSRGGGPCSKDCPYYAEEGWVRGVNGIPLKTHCRGTMQDVIINCDIYNPQCIDKVEVTEEQWKTMLRSVHKRAIRQRKLYPEDHAEIHAVGCEWTRSKGKWNAEKSSNVKH